MIIMIIMIVILIIIITIMIIMINNSIHSVIVGKGQMGSALMGSLQKYYVF